MSTNQDTIFGRLVGDFGITASSGSDREDSVDGPIQNFIKPTHILVNRWFPGYWTADITGKNADEAIGWLLASSLSSYGAPASVAVDRLEELGRLLSTPSVAEGIIGALFPRTTITAKAGRHYISEEFVTETVINKLEKFNVNYSVRMAYSHVVMRFLVHLDFVKGYVEQRIAHLTDSFTVNVPQLQKLLIMDGLRDVLSEARIAAAAKEIHAESTPQVIGSGLARLLRAAAHSIPEIALRLEQLEIAHSLVGIYLTDPTSLPLAVRSRPSLAQLASIANFTSLFFSIQAPTLPATEINEMKIACDEILTLISSSPIIEQITLSDFASYFGVVPTVAPDGWQRGAVIYRASNQQSRMDVVNMVPLEGGATITLLSSNYVPVTTIAKDLSTTVLGGDAMLGLAAIAADELARQPFSFGDRPQLWSINASAEDIDYIAMAKAEALAVTRDGPSSTASVLFGTKVSDKWRMQVSMATPGMAYFSRPADVILYTTGDAPTIPKPMAARAQGLEMNVLSDIVYLGKDVVDRMSNRVMEPFSFNISVNVPGAAEPTLLRIVIPALGPLVGYGDRAPNRGLAEYVTIFEPGVDPYVEQALSIAVAYAELTGTDKVLADRAKSWLIETLLPIVGHPAIIRTAERALARAIKDAKLDGRTLGSQWREINARLLYGTIIAILTRFNKVPNALANRLLDAIPVSSLTVRAALAMATTPTQLNAQLLIEQ